MGTGELRRIHSRVSWMFLPVERSMTVSAPQRVAHVIFSTSSSIEDATAGPGPEGAAHAREPHATEGRVLLARLPVDRRRARQLLDVAAPEDPGEAKRRQAALQIDGGLGVGVGAARVVEAERRIAPGERDR